MWIMEIMSFISICVSYTHGFTYFLSLFSLHLQLMQASYTGLPNGPLSEYQYCLRKRKKILQILQKLSSGVNSGTNFAEADHEIFCYKILVFIWWNTWETCKHILFKVFFMFACVTLCSIIPTLKIVPKSFDFNQLPIQIFISKIKKPFPFARA